LSHLRRIDTAASIPPPKRTEVGTILQTEASHVIALSIHARSIQSSGTSQTPVIGNAKSIHRQMHPW
jgi:hypothetical protein